MKLRITSEWIDEIHAIPLSRVCSITIHKKALSMTTSRLFHLLSVSTSLFASACVSESSSDQVAPAAEGTAVHMMPLRDAQKAVSDIAPAVAPHLQFFGGPVLKNIDIHPVWWNSAARFSSNFASFYPAVS